MHLENKTSRPLIAVVRKKNDFYDLLIKKQNKKKQVNNKHHMIEGEAAQLFELL